MRDHYDFGKMKGEKNPYLRHIKQPITIRLDTSTVAYFKELAREMGMPYQNLLASAFGWRGVEEKLGMSDQGGGLG